MLGEEQAELDELIGEDNIKGAINPFKVAEDAILEFMDQKDIQANLLSEEAGFVDRGFDEVLVIDPVDGTFNAVQGIPFFSISIANNYCFTIIIILWSSSSSTKLFVL